MRGADDAHVDRDLTLAADAPDLTGLEDPQQTRLHVERQLADLVEEERALVRLLEEAAPRARRTGEGALLVPEELTLDEGRRHAASVDRDEGLAASGPALVERPGDELLADARLAGDEHAERRGRVAFDLGDELA